MVDPGCQLDEFYRPLSSGHAGGWGSSFQGLWKQKDWPTVGGTIPCPGFVLVFTLWADTVWSAASSSCYLEFPAVMEYPLRLWGKKNPSLHCCIAVVRVFYYSHTSNRSSFVSWLWPTEPIWLVYTVIERDDMLRLYVEEPVNATFGHLQRENPHPVT